MRLKTTVILTCLFAGFSFSCMAQKGYAGTAITNQGDTLAGFIAFKMDKPNDDAIEITTTSEITTKGNGNVSKTTSSETIKINPGFINYIKVNDSIYYFRDVQVVNQSSKYNRNMCLRLTTGSVRNKFFNFKITGVICSIWLSFQI